MTDAIVRDAPAALIRYALESANEAFGSWDLTAGEALRWPSLSEAMTAEKLRAK